MTRMARFRRLDRARAVALERGVDDGQRRLVDRGHGPIDAKQIRRVRREAVDKDPCIRPDRARVDAPLGPHVRR
jgi:hypothetical protein